MWRTTKLQQEAKKLSRRRNYLAEFESEKVCHLASEKRMSVLLGQMVITVRLRFETRRAEEAAELRLFRRSRPVRSVRRRAPTSGRATVAVGGSGVRARVARLAAVVVGRRRPFDGSVAGTLGLSHRLQVDEAVLLKLVLGLELAPRAAQSAREQNVALLRVPDAATVGHVRVDPVDGLAGEASPAVVAGVDLQVLRQGHEPAPDELLGRLALGDGRVGPLQVVENLPGFDKLWAGAHLDVAPEDVVL